LTVVTGKAGSGKSYLALGYLLQEIHSTKNTKPKKVYIITNNVPMRGTSTFGLKKGDIISKIMQSNLGAILKTKLGLEYTEMLIKSGTLNIVTLEDIRGASFDGHVYVTEAQNYTKDMMKTIIERMEEDGQLILDGDERQIDMVMASGINNGISRALTVFGGDELLGHVRLEGNMRGKLSELADKM
jgi:predicted ribonuclease YlaK